VSLVAKVFVVLNLIVSVAFLVFAANVWTAQTKWQKMYEKEKIANVEELAAIQKREIALARDVVHWQRTVDKKDGEITKLKLDFNAARDRELQVQTELATVKNARDMKDAENQELQREVRRYLEELQKIKGVVIKQQQAVVVERENATRYRNEKAELENELNTLKQSYATLARDNAETSRDLSRQTARIQSLIEKGVPVYTLLNEDATATQPVLPDSVVLAVQRDVGLVMLSIGSAQNVKPGYQLTIARGDQYIGKVQVDRVYPDMCSAKIIAPLMKGEVQVNDEARSK
jgi:hypothetical protein